MVPWSWTRHLPPYIGRNQLSLPAGPETGADGVVTSLLRVVLSLSGQRAT